MSRITVRRPVPAMLAAALATLALALPAHAQSDWDAYMLQLINRARTDPAAENALQDSSYNHPAVTPLAYDLNVADAAAGHTNWIHLNIANPDLTVEHAPRSFSHYQTHDGQPGGTALTGSPGYTGAGIGERITAAGFTWSAARENLAAAWSSTPIPIDAERIEETHEGLWHSEGHRFNIMADNVRLFGFSAETRPVTPDADNAFPSWTNNFYTATQKFARPQYWNSPDQYAFGLIYRDLDGSGDWTPRQAGDPLREGLAGVDFDVFAAGSGTVISSGTTMANGAFTVALEPGDYDLRFAGAEMPGGQWWIEDFNVASEWNTDLGLIDIPEPTLLVGDMNLDGVVDTGDVAAFVLALTDASSYVSQFGVDAATMVELGDINGDGAFDTGDVAPFVQLLVGGDTQTVAGVASVPEPGVAAVMVLGLMVGGLRRRWRFGDCRSRHRGYDPTLGDARWQFVRTASHNCINAESSRRNERMPR